MILEWLKNTQLAATLRILRNGQKQNGRNDPQDCPMMDGDKRVVGDKERTYDRRDLPPTG